MLGPLVLGCSWLHSASKENLERVYLDYPFRARLFTHAYVEIGSADNFVKIIVHDHCDLGRIAMFLHLLQLVDAIVYFRSAIFDADTYMYRANLGFSYSRRAFKLFNAESMEVLDKLADSWRFSPALTCQEQRPWRQDLSCDNSWLTAR